MKAIRKLLIIVLAVLMVFSMAACDKGTTEPQKIEALYERPDFSKKPIAAGTEIITTFDEMYEWFMAYEKPKLSISDELYLSKQTLYKNEELTDGTPLEENIDLLGYIVTLFYCNDFDSFKMDKTNWSSGQNGKMFFMNDSSLPQECESMVPVECAFDLTTNTVLFRGFVKVNDEMQSSDIYIELTLNLIDGMYEVSYTAMEFGYTSETDYVATSSEVLRYKTDEAGEIIACEYSCLEKETVAQEEWSEEEKGIKGSIKYETSNFLINITIGMKDDKYAITRDTSFKYAESYKEEDVKEHNRISQTIDFINGHYILTETVIDYENNGQSDTYYLVYQPQSE